MNRYRVQSKDKEWGYDTGYHISAKNATIAKKKVAEHHEFNPRNLTARKLGWK